MYARFDDVSSGFYQRIFDFGNGRETDVVSFGQQSNTAHVYLEVCQSTGISHCFAYGAIDQGVMALWRVEITAAGI